MLSVVAGVLTQVGSSSNADPWTVSSNPVWSPDGTSVAWSEVSSTGNRYRIEIAAATAMSTPRAAISGKADEGCCEWLTWTRSNRFLYVANFRLYSVSATGGKPTVLFRGSTPRYILSPNQETVAVVEGCDCGHATDKIALVDVRGGRAHELPVAKNASDDPVSFSPDGTELVFSTATLNPKTGSWSHSHLMAVHVGGGTPVPLAAGGIIGEQFLTANMTSPNWSPDGNWIAAWLQTSTTARLVTIDTRSGRTTLAAPPRTQAWAVSWSPDSTRLAYAATLRLGNDAQMAVATAYPDGTNRKTFWGRASALDYDTWNSREPPAWSPNSNKLVFLARTGGGGGPMSILTAGADGRGLLKIH